MREGVGKLNCFCSPSGVGPLLCAFIICFKAPQRTYSFSFWYILIHIQAPTLPKPKNTEFCIIHHFELFGPLIPAIIRITKRWQQTVSFNLLVFPSLKPEQHILEYSVITETTIMLLVIQVLVKWELKIWFTYSPLQKSIRMSTSHTSPLLTLLILESM